MNIISSFIDPKTAANYNMSTVFIWDGKVVANLKIVCVQAFIEYTVKNKAAVHVPKKKMKENKKKTEAWFLPSSSTAMQIS